MNFLAAFLFRRFRWMALGWVVKNVARRGVGRSVDQAGAEVKARIDDRLPAPVRSAAGKVGVDLADIGGRVGGPALVAREQSRRMGTAAAVTARSGRRAAAVPGRVRRRAVDVAAEARRQLDAEVDDASRRLRSQAAGHATGPAAATEALLDLRHDARRADEPLPEVPDEVDRGRRRARRSLPAPEQPRVQRTYRPPTKPWDRPLRRRVPARKSRDGGDQGG
ncbi:MAG: hypothetical protein ACRBI6_16860 [Acidimicrobiales bacterium]